jgi:putative FmdB family regulatory protein
VPLFEYRCSSCGAEFEALVRGAETPPCVACGSTQLERLLTSFAVSSARRSARALEAARDTYRHSKARAERREQEAADVREHLQEDYGVDLAGKNDLSGKK